MLRLCLSVALLSAVMIAFQLLLMQTLAIAHWQHFAHMIVSVALLGFGTSGTVLALLREPLMRRASIVLPVTMTLCGLSLGCAIPASELPALEFDLFLLFFEPQRNLRLLIHYILFFLPFLFGALALAVVFTRDIKKIGLLYSANLGGSAAGGALGIALLFFGSPMQMIAVAGLLAVAAGALATPPRHARLWILHAAAGLLLLWPLLSDLRVSPGQYKSISKTLNLPGAEIVADFPSPLGLVQAVEAPVLRYAPGLSLAFPGEVPQSRAIFVNGSGYGSVIPPEIPGAGHIKDFTTGALPFLLTLPEEVLVLRAGGGVDVQHALAQGARKVAAVEPHPQVAELVMERYGAVTGDVFNREEVRLVVSEPRAYLASAEEDFSIIIFPPVGAFGGTAGLQAMQEEYLMTVQSFEEAWKRLEADGALAVTVWTDFPPRSAPKLFATLMEMLRRQGIGNPREHLAAIRSWSTITFSVTKRRLAPEEISRALAFCEERMFDPVILPGLEEGQRQNFNQLQDEPLLTLFDRLLDENAEEVYADYAFQIEPATDNKPYFSHFLRLRDLWKFRTLFDSRSPPALELGLLFVALTFAQISVLAAALILLPLMRIGWKGTNPMRTIVYFGGIGAGFMLIEMMSIQRLVLFWGHPIYSAAAVIGGLLVGAGIGSYLSGGRPAQRPLLRRLLLLLLAAAVVYFLALEWLLPLFMGFELHWKFLIGLALIVSLGVAMGFPFPLGLRLLSLHNDAQTPWAWGINGCVSVVSASAAALLSATGGFHFVMLLAVLAYAAAWFAAPDG